jgi:hypothetical protein
VAATRDNREALVGTDHEQRKAMRIAILTACLLASAACADPGDELSGSWTITRTIESRTPECLSGQPGDAMGTRTITIDPTNDDKPVSEVDASGITDGVVWFSTLETVDGFETISTSELTYDGDTDRLVGSGGLGCGTGCRYVLQAIGARE